VHSLFRILSNGLFVVCITFSSALAAQYNGWQCVNVDNIASFDIPTTMEIQSEHYREAIRSVSKNDEVQVKTPKFGSIICQQKGLNLVGTPYCNNTQYSRIMFNTFFGKNIGLTLGEKLNLTTTELEELKKAFLTAIKTCEKYGNKIFDVSSLEIINRDFGECLLLKYKRQLNNKPVVQIYDYYMFDKNRLFQLTISYRISEFNVWCDPPNDIRNVINTLRVY